MNNEYIVYGPSDPQKPFSLTLAGITYENPDYYISRTNSPFSVVEYVMSGKGYLKIDGKEYAVSAGDMYIIPPSSTHLYRSDPQNPWKKIWFNSSGILLSELLRIYGINQKNVFKNADGSVYLKKILKICGDKTVPPEETDSRAAAVMFELVCFLANLQNKSKDETNPDALKIKSYINTNVDKNITISELSKLIFRSESQTVRIFKAAYGTTPYDYLLGQKIERANLFLQNTRLPVKEIAIKLGFCDEHYFSNLYKKRCGITPSDFRKSSGITITNGNY